MRSLTRFVIPAAAFLASVTSSFAEHDFTSSIGLTSKSDVDFNIRGLYDFLPAGAYLPIEIDAINKTEKALKWDMVWSSRSSNGSLITLQGTLRADAEETANSVWLIPTIAAPASGSPGGNLHFSIVGPYVERGSATQYSGSSAAATEPFAVVAGFEASWWEAVEKAQSSSGGDALLATRFPASKMVTDWRALAGFSAVILREEEWNRLPPEKRNVLLEYTAQGGLLIVCAPTEDVRGFPKGKLGLGETKVFLLGDEHGMRMAAELQSLPATPARRIADGYPADWKLGKTVRRFPAPHIVIVGLMVIFGLVIGPINFYVFAKEGARHRLFFTTPIIALAATGLMFLFIVIRDGFGGEGQRFLAAVSLPDLRILSVAQEQLSRTGLLSTAVFSLEPNVYIQPINPKRDTGGPVNSTRGLSYTFRGNLLEGDWFRSRTLQAQYLAAQIPSRGRIEIFQSGKTPPEAQSYFEHVLGRFYYRDDKGHVWTAASIGTGERVVLTMTKNTEFTQWWNETTSNAGPWLKERLRVVGMEKESFFAESADGPLIPTLQSIKWKGDHAVFLGRVVKSP